MALVEDEQVIKTRFANRAYPAFSKGIGIGRVKRGPNNLQALGFEDRVERAGEFGVPIVDQKTCRLRPIPE